MSDTTRIDELQKLLGSRLENLQLVNEELNAVRKNILLAKANVMDLEIQARDIRDKVAKARHLTEVTKNDINIAKNEYWNNK